MDPGGAITLSLTHSDTHACGRTRAYTHTYTHHISAWRDRWSERCLLYRLEFYELWLWLSDTLTDCCTVIVHACVWDPHRRCLGCTHCANTVAGTEGAHKVAAAQQHCREDSLRAVELIPDGLADSGHVRIQHHREQAGDVNRHTRHRARALPVVGWQRSVKLWIKPKR